MFEPIDRIWNDTCIVEIIISDGKYGIADEDNKILIPAIYDEIYRNFTSAIFKKDGKYGFLFAWDTNKNILPNCEYDFIDDLIFMSNCFPLLIKNRKKSIAFVDNNYITAEYDAIEVFENYVLGYNYEDGKNNTTLIDLCFQKEIDLGTKSNITYLGCQNDDVYYRVGQWVNDDRHYYDLVCEFETGNYKKVPCEECPEDIITVNYLHNGLYAARSLNFKINSIRETKKSTSISIDFTLHSKLPSATFQKINKILEKG